ncbi:metallophosphoesterase family protein [Pseudoroseicyclus aestuarii]|uniref:Calcineurin-like phosphoesterase family protein n=1 Tax=Pseudoroseicyclus aestuarii TaxID=1795041 RepID=A0A318SMG7_9RHOB|nr:metallophosphoesterase [Pseudoroseicyclus aestuarii]PYE80896.1 calcineurin-like phosphoesterase family protein [Pseudoroseicyclus aestuarii]
MIRRILHITDIHIGGGDGAVARNWDLAVEVAKATPHDLCVLTGDYVRNGPDEGGALAQARAQLDRLPGPWLCLPGDHDTGGAPPLPRPRPEVPWLANYGVTRERLSRYKALFGPDHWQMGFHNWSLIGLNDSLFESGFPEEALQWRFLDQALAAAGSRPVVLFMHKPPCLRSLTETDDRTKTIPAAARARLLEATTKADIRAIICGHLHEARSVQSEGVMIISGPTLIRQKDDYPASLGMNVNGVTLLEFLDQEITAQILPLPYAEHPRSTIG